MLMRVGLPGNFFIQLIFVASGATMRALFKEFVKV